MKWKRKCPKCNREQTYTRKESLTFAEKQNAACHSCANRKIMNGRKRPEQSIQMKGKNNPNWRPRGKEYTKWQSYKLDVRNITRRQSLYLLENFDKRGRAGISGAYQIDHIISISKGFRRKISAEVIGNIKNLRMIPWLDNIKKGK